MNCGSVDPHDGHWVDDDWCQGRSGLITGEEWATEWLASQTDAHSAYPVVSALLSRVEGLLGELDKEQRKRHDAEAKVRDLSRAPKEVVDALMAKRMKEIEDALDNLDTATWVVKSQLGLDDDYR